MKTWQTWLVIVLLGGGIVGACNTLFVKQTPGQKAFDVCAKDLIAKNQQTPENIEVCKTLKRSVDAGNEQP